MATQSWAELIAKAETAPVASGKVLPKATYRCVAKQRKVSQKEGKKECLSVMYEVIDGPEQGTKFWDNMYISPESPVALSIFFQQFERLGGNKDTLLMGGNLEAATASVEGRILNVTVDVEEWPKGNIPPSMRNRVTALRAVDPGSTPPTHVPAGPPAAPAAPAVPGINGSPF